MTQLTDAYLLELAERLDGKADYCLKYFASANFAELLRDAAAALRQVVKERGEFVKVDRINPPDQHPEAP